MNTINLCVPVLSFCDAPGVAHITLFNSSPSTSVSETLSAVNSYVAILYMYLNMLWQDVRLCPGQ